jgi:hypothetical protein
MRKSRSLMELMRCRNSSVGVLSFTCSWHGLGTSAGDLNEVRGKCGKQNCACAAPGHAGHGPQ